MESEIADFALRRAEGVYSYQLAVVVNDAWKRITYIVRDADLLYSAPHQIYLQKLLEYAALAICPCLWL